MADGGNVTRTVKGARRPRGEASDRTAAEQQPIAIIGMACRLPGAARPDALWNLLAGAISAITDPPDDRARAGHTRRAGYLDHVDTFDPAFFGMSPREAAAHRPPAAAHARTQLGGP